MVSAWFINVFVLRYSGTGRYYVSRQALGHLATRSYCVGDIINGCMLAKIREDRVRLECDGEKVRLYLH